MTTQPSPSPSAEDSYLGYRWPPAPTTVRMPSGGHVVLSGSHELELADVILRDRLGEAPCAYLTASFARDWVRPFGRGEFFWPVEAIDEWIAAATAARPAEDCSATPMERAFEVMRRTLGLPLAHHPLRPSTPMHPGAH